MLRTMHSLQYKDIIYAFIISENNKLLSLTLIILKAENKINSMSLLYPFLP